jgi:hypothetical protein
MGNESHEKIIPTIVPKYPESWEVKSLSHVRIASYKCGMSSRAARLEAYSYYRTASRFPTASCSFQAVYGKSIGPRIRLREMRKGSGIVEREAVRVRVGIADDCRRCRSRSTRRIPAASAVGVLSDK